MLNSFENSIRNSKHLLRGCRATVAHEAHNLVLRAGGFDSLPRYQLKEIIVKKIHRGQRIFRDGIMWVIINMGGGRKGDSTQGGVCAIAIDDLDRSGYSRKEVSKISDTSAAKFRAFCKKYSIRVLKIDGRWPSKSGLVSSTICHWL